MVLELFEAANDGVKRRKATVKKTSRKRYVAYRMSKWIPCSSQNWILNAVEPDICSKFQLSNPSKLASPSSLFSFLALWLFILEAIRPAEPSRHVKVRASFGGCQERFRDLLVDCHSIIRRTLSFVIYDSYSTVKQYWRSIINNHSKCYLFKCNKSW